MGCGDLRSPLTTAVGTRHNQYLHIHINDDKLLIIARNILILKIISSPEFDPSKEADMDYVWHIWYDATWPESTLKRFMQDIKNLLSQPLPQSIFIPESSIYLEKLKAVWSKWLSVATNFSAEEVLADRYQNIIHFECTQILIKNVLKITGPNFLSTLAP